MVSIAKSSHQEGRQAPITASEDVESKCVHQPSARIEKGIEGNSKVGLLLVGLSLGLLGLAFESVG
jgi:hypothetical protein